MLLVSLRELKVSVSLNPFFSLNRSVNIVLSMMIDFSGFRTVCKPIGEELVRRLTIYC